MGVAKGHTATEWEKREGRWQPWVVRLPIPPATPQPRPQFITKAWRDNVLWGFKKGEGISGKGSWRRQQLELYLVGSKEIFVAQVPKSLGVLPLQWRSGPPASGSHLLAHLWLSPFPRQEEIWQLWVKLRGEEPQLAGSLEGFLATMSSRLQEVRADREVLELTLRK